MYYLVLRSMSREKMDRIQDLAEDSDVEYSYLVVGLPSVVPASDREGKKIEAEMEAEALVITDLLDEIID